MTVSVRKARPGEENAVKALLAETWHDAHDAVLGAARVAEITGRWHSLGRLAEQIADPQVLFLVAEDDDGRLVGHALAQMDIDGGLHLIRLYVRPGFQGEGIGTLLLEMAIAHYPEALLLRLEVQAHSLDARRFYEGHGLRVVADTGEAGGYTDVPALIMEKLLA